MIVPLSLLFKFSVHRNYLGSSLKVYVSLALHSEILISGEIGLD